MSKRPAAETQDEHSHERARDLLERVNSICCPITCQIMEDPVTLAFDSTNYERSAIVKWLSSNGTSPMYNTALNKATATLTPNEILRTAIREMLAEASAALRALDDPAALREGALVELHSLKGAPRLNGALGELGAFDAGAGRFVVRVLSSGAAVKARSTNLRRRLAPDEDSAAAMQLAVSTQRALKSALQALSQNFAESYEKSAECPKFSEKLLKESREKMELAIELDFGCGVAHHVLAHLATLDDDLGGVAKALTRWAANGGGTEARVQLAAAYGSLGQRKKERAILASVLESDPSHFDARFALAQHLVCVGAGQESEIPNFKASYLGRFPLVLADLWTSDHLSERPRSEDAFSGTRARRTLTLKRR